MVDEFVIGLPVDEVMRACLGASALFAWAITAQDENRIVFSMPPTVPGESVEIKAHFASADGLSTTVSLVGTADGRGRSEALSLQMGRLRRALELAQPRGAGQDRLDEDFLEPLEMPPRRTSMPSTLMLRWALVLLVIIVSITITLVITSTATNNLNRIQNQLSQASQQVQQSLSGITTTSVP